MKRLQQKTVFVQNKPGFTLIELLAAVLIIGILAAVGVAQYQKVHKKTCLTLYKAGYWEAIKKMKLFRLENGRFPDNARELLDFAPGSGWLREGNDSLLYMKYPCYAKSFYIGITAGGTYGYVPNDDSIYSWVSESRYPYCFTFGEAPNPWACQTLTGAKERNANGYFIDVSPVPM